MTATRPRKPRNCPQWATAARRPRYGTANHHELIGLTSLAATFDTAFSATTNSVAVKGVLRHAW